MVLELKLLDGRSAAPRAIAAPGETLHVGRLKGENNLYVPDPLLAPVHFRVTFDGRSGRLQDLSQVLRKHGACEKECFTAALRNSPCSGICRLNDRGAGSGVHLNGQRVSDAPLAHGDVLVAGGSCFGVSVMDAALPAETASSPRGALTREQQLRALEFFAKQRLPLFAIVDAARSPELLELLRVHADVYYSLYDGPEAEKLVEVAPYLVQLSSRSALLAALIGEQWGNSWGVFALALTDFKSLRRHLRRFLMVQDARGKDMYFRYYDPRVLRVFLPTASAAELGDFFGPVSGFVIEGEDPGTAWLCAFQPGSQLRVDTIAL